MCTTQTRGRRHVLIRDHQGKTTRILAAVGVDIEDAEGVTFRKVLAVNDIADMDLVRSGQTCPGDDLTGRDTKNTLVTHDHEEAPLAICLVGHRVS